MNRTRLTLLLVFLAPLGCSFGDDPSKTLTLATTTSVRDSGLLNVLVPLFEKQNGINVRVIAVGSGQALELGRRGDADVLLTHAPRAEEKFMAEGFGHDRRTIMSNDFVLVGPEADPARAGVEESLTGAFRRIACSRTPFVSRGDESGTHMKERQVWRDTGIEPHGNWYLSAGAGMAEVVRMASEIGAYTLVDRSTFLAQRGRLELAIAFEGDPRLRNVYSVIVVSPSKHPHIRYSAARQFAEFLSSSEAQKMIGSFGVDGSSEPLFLPASR